MSKRSKQIGLEYKIKKKGYNFRMYLDDDDYGGNFQIIVHFPNNYGASIIQNEYSYGRENDQFELAVIQFEEYDQEDFRSGWEIVYDTGITEDVLGRLEIPEVMMLLEEIEDL